jgi:UMF1 family MFS transporter
LIQHKPWEDAMTRPAGDTGKRRGVLAWALYDWANSAFAITVMSAFFPLFLKQYWAAGADAVTTTFRLGLANSIAGVAIAVLSPVLGAIADRGGTKKRYLICFTAMAILMTGSLQWVARGDWPLAVMLYALATIGFSGSNAFYDALLVDVARERDLDRVSSLGFALGYLGGGLLFALNVAMTLWPERFGLAGPAEAIRLSFGLVALWWAVFSVPLLLFVKERAPASALAGWAAVAAGFRQLAATLREIRGLRAAYVFLIAYLLYIDGVGTLARMALDYGMALGFRESDLIVALLITQFIGFPASIAFGHLGARFGAKAGIYLGLGTYVAATLWAYRMEGVTEFYALAVVVGLVQGGVQALSRSLFARIMPADRPGEFFGFYNMLGKFAVILGPLLVGITALASGSSRASVLVVVALFVAGGVLLYFVDEINGAIVPARK